MPNVIQLDDLATGLTIMYSGVSYKLRDLTADDVAAWRRAIRRHNRLEAQLNELDTKCQSADISDEDFDEMDERAAEVQSQQLENDAGIMVRVMPGLTLEIAQGMSLKQRTRIMRAITENLGLEESDTAKNVGESQTA